MKLKRVFFLIGALWELGRFLLLFSALLLTFHQVVVGNRQTVCWLLLFGAPQLLLPAGLLVLYTASGAQPALLNLMRLGKILAVFSSLLLFVLEPLGLHLGYGGSLISFLLTPLFILVGVVFVDIVFLFFLLSYSPERDGESREEESLPDFKENRVSDFSEP
jgi:hypothetical protein